ncbi:MAG TPA: type I polyketide synthase [bacterium]|nr:type I polyketide synthase [bacterium]
MKPSIAIVGMACRYPDARTPQELWENVLAQRQAFRRIPPQRLRLEDYLAQDRAAADTTYSTEAAVLEGYEFDRVRFRVSADAFRAADMTHWLALDVAVQALADAGFPGGAGLPRDTTGVVLGNTLTGDGSRANALRLRWPFVRRTVEASLAAEDWPTDRQQAFLSDLEARFKAPFPAPNEETLAGNLSNTIAGRICNYLDLKGGGYATDGACASSLLAVTQACAALEAGDLNVAIAGGVDISLDPFELVGFARTGALAANEMRVYDTRPTGFLPGEGCGFVVLMRSADANAQARRVYAEVRGWGISSDGHGGITRPEMAGQRLALRRAYDRAGFGIDTVAYFEGHGTGTAVGDNTEILTLSTCLAEAGASRPAALGTVKANIGHTKAAAGIAGLLKSTMAVWTQVVPPVTGCRNPHQALTARSGVLRVPDEGVRWPSDQPLRSGVSAMGFGGINVHVAIEAATPARRGALTSDEQTLLSSAQDAELFLLGGRSIGELRAQLDQIRRRAASLSRAEMTDLAAALARQIRTPVARAAVVASTPAEFGTRLETLHQWTGVDARTRLDPTDGVFFATGLTAPRIAFLFPGQGSPVRRDGGALGRRFRWLDDAYAHAPWLRHDGEFPQAMVQSAIVMASLIAIDALDSLGIGAAVAIGHSLGELTALHWAGALDREALLRVVAARGAAMTALKGPHGAMASIAAGPEEVRGLLNGDDMVIAALNAPRQTVVSGAAAAVMDAAARARAAGFAVTLLPVAHAFHSPLVAGAVSGLAESLARETLRPLRRAVISTVTGSRLAAEEDLRALLCRQITAPVRFADAVACAPDIDLWLEVGPGQALRGLVRESTEGPVVALDAGGDSLGGILRAAGAVFALGVPIRQERLFGDRFARPFEVDTTPRFLENPCESAAGPFDQPPAVLTAEAPHRAPSEFAASDSATDVLTLVRRLVAERVSLPLEVVKDGDRMLTDLHLNSIGVGQLVVDAARHLAVPPPPAPTDFANLSVAEIAQALEEAARLGGAASNEEGGAPPGVDRWVRPFVVGLDDAPLPPPAPSGGGGAWRVIAPPGHALAAELTEVLRGCGEGGTAVCLPPEDDDSCVALLLEGARAALHASAGSRFVLVQHDRTAASVAKTLHLEAPALTTCVVTVPRDHPQAAGWIRAEAAAAVGYVEACYDSTGRRRTPVLNPLTLSTAAVPDGELADRDVLLVTGGGRGIGFECALGLAENTSLRLVLLGRSDPITEPELAANLERLRAAGVPFRYLAADITDADAVRAAVREAEGTLGPITAVLHAAGTNVPQLLATLTIEEVRGALAPKLDGLRNVLASLNEDRLRLLIAFGSAIAETGLAGEAHYAVANEWLTHLTGEFQAAHPTCRCLVVEWSVWSDVGMGARLGRIGALERAGIAPIAPAAGVDILRQLIAQPSLPSAVVVGGRLGTPPTLRMAASPIPLWRFLEQPRVHYAGVELVADAELSTLTDPYLDDHIFGDDRVFPAVMALEAMAQAAVTLAGSGSPASIDGISFDRPIVVPARDRVTVRVAALVREPGCIEVVLRSSTTAFRVDHVRAVCRIGPMQTIPPAAPACRPAPPGRVPLDPATDLYGDLLFHTGRFRRVAGYRRLRTTECVAQLASVDPTPWFGHYLPQHLVLADPAGRDAAVHAVQACVPAEALLPIGAARFVPGELPKGPRFAHARERHRAGDLFVYDVDVSDADGRVCERWEGLQFRRMHPQKPRQGWPPALLGPCVERHIRDVLAPGSTVSVVIRRECDPRRSRGDQVLRFLLGDHARIVRRLNGKPDVAGAGRTGVSAAHAGALVMGAAASGPVGCDLEPVTDRRSVMWRGLLGADYVLTGLVTRETGECEAETATRLWSIRESLTKVGVSPTVPMRFVAASNDGWAHFAAGSFCCASYIADIKDIQGRVALAVTVPAPGDPSQSRHRAAVPAGDRPGSRSPSEDAAIGGGGRARV